MSWCRYSAITSICRRASSTIALQQPFSTSAPLHKKFKPQELFLLPGQPKARKSKIPKKALAYRARREGLTAEALEVEPDPIAIFAEEVELNPHRHRADDGDSPFGLKPGTRRATSTRRSWRDDDGYSRSQEDGQTLGIGRRASLFGRGTTTTQRQASSFAETRMSQRARETSESLVDLNDASTNTVEPVVEVNPATVVPAWKIPTPLEYERYGRRNSRASVTGKERRSDDGRGEPRRGWSDLADPRAERGRRDTSRNPPSGRRPGGEPIPTLQPTPVADDTTAKPSATADRTPGRWEPTKKISIPAMQGLRALHQSDPKTFNHAVLSEKFGISREAVGRIIHSRFRDEQ